MGRQAALSQQALQYTQEFHWSVIPIKGESAPPGNAEKEPVAPWKHYQLEIPGPAVLHNWFTGDNAYTALAIITGPVSQLAVLDFDDQELYARFALAFPELIQTRTVLSGNRGLPHLYFRLVPPPIIDAACSRQRPQNHRWDGADFQYNGRYVIAPPTTIRGKEWRCIREGLRTLTIDEYLQIVDWFEGQGSSEPLRVSINDPDSTSCTNQHNGNTTPAPDIKKTIDAHIRTGSASNNHRYSDQQIISLYWRRCHTLGGRNNALFSAACTARDDGRLQAEAAALLIDPHTQNQQAGRPETDHSRRREAARTIASAYQRPKPANNKTLDTSRLHEQPEAVSGEHSRKLPNSLREHLLQTFGAYAPRTLEALYNSYRPGQVIYNHQGIANNLKYGVCADAWHKTVEAKLISRYTPVIGRTASAVDRQQNACCHAEKNSSIIDKRKKYYRIPSPRELMERFGLDQTGSDPIPVEAIGNCALYRAYKLFGMIDRFQYPTREKLGHALGVTGRTIYNYFRLLGIKTSPRTIAYPLSWETLNQLFLPGDDWGIDIHRGEYLQTHQKRYPPKREIAALLLSQKTPVNFIKIVGLAIGEAASTPTDYANQRLEIVPQPKTPAKPRKPELTKREISFVKRLHREIGGLSRANAEYWVMDYGVKVIRQALARLKKAKSKQKIKNPAGYLLAILENTNAPKSAYMRPLL